jgi:hypothetical protein
VQLGGVLLDAAAVTRAQRLAEAGQMKLDGRQCRLEFGVGRRRQGS